ncbi:MAG: RNA methyltransferase, partial [Deltaproteobacteria bacterium]
AIIRSAAAAGANGIILPKDRSAPVSATVYKVSAGTVAAIDFCQVSNLSAALNLLQDNGIWIFGLEGSAEDTIFDLDLRVPLCLVIGSEGKGIRPLVRRSCDVLAAIPLAAKVESLNASAAAAVALFEVVRQRQLQVPS